MHLEGCCFVPQHLGHLIRHLKDQGRPIHFLHLWLFRTFIKEGSLWMKNIHPSSEKTSSFKLFHDYKKTDQVTIFIVYQKYMQYFYFFHLLPLDVLSWFDIKFKFYSTNIIMHYSWYLKISGYIPVVTTGSWSILVHVLFAFLDLANYLTQSLSCNPMLISYIKQFIV